MSIIEFSTLLGQYPLIVLAVFVSIPLFAYVYGRLHDRHRGSLAPHKYVYAAVVYVTSIPGAFATAITVYTMFFLAGNLLTVNILVYFLPIISMIVTLVFINRRVKLEVLPGFGRISALFILLFISFILAFVIQRTYILLMFRGSVFVYFGLVVALFLILRYAGRRFFAAKP